MLSDLSPQFQVPNADLLKCNGLYSSKWFIAFKGFPSKNHSFSQEKKQPYQVLVLKYAVKYIRLWKAASKKAVLEGNNAGDLLVISSINWKQM